MFTIKKNIAAAYEKANKKIEKIAAKPRFSGALETLESAKVIAIEKRVRALARENDLQCAFLYDTAEVTLTFSYPENFTLSYREDLWSNAIRMLNEVAACLNIWFELDGGFLESVYEVFFNYLREDFLDV